MPIFVAKPGPVLRWSRLCHVSIAFTATAIGGHLWGYEGSVFVGAGAIALGFAWECCTSFIRGPHTGWHPYGDALDFWSFALGAMAAGVAYALIC
jgi:hypothetical protein